MTDIRYISTKEAAGIMGLSTRRVVGLCNAGKLEGALRKGRNWKVPEEIAYAYIGAENLKREMERSFPSQSGTHLTWM